MQRLWPSPLLVLALACAPHRPAAPIVPLTQVKLGDTTFYGPGIVAARPWQVKFDLSVPAYVTLIRVWSPGDAEVVYPMSAAASPPERRSGVQSILVPASRLPNRERPPNAESGPVVAYRPTYVAAWASPGVACSATRDLANLRQRTDSTSQPRPVGGVCLVPVRAGALSQPSRWPLLPPARQGDHFLVLIATERPVAPATIRARLAAFTAEHLSTTTPAVRELPISLLADQAGRWGAWIVRPH